MRRLLWLLFWALVVASAWQACASAGREKMLPVKPGALRAGAGPR